MKHAAFLVAPIALAMLMLPLISPMRADAATRVVRSRDTKDKDDDQDRKAPSTIGNVSRSRGTGNVLTESAGNVRSTRTTTSRVTRTSSSSSGDTNTGSDRRVTYTSGSSRASTVRRVTRTTTPVVPNTSSGNVTRSLRPSDTLPTARHIVQHPSGTMRVSSTTPTVRRPLHGVDTRTHHGSDETEPTTRYRTGNVIIGTGNVETSGPRQHIRSPQRIVRREEPEPPRDDHRHRHRWPRHHHIPPYPWPVVRTEYVERVVVQPVVVERVVVVQPVEVYEPGPAVLPEAVPVRQYEDYLTRQQVSDPLVTVALPLTPVEYRRAQVLIARGLIGDLLSEGDVGGRHSYELDPNQATLTITAPSERITIIETMLGDERTFRAVTESNRFGHTAGVVALVSPYFLQEDFEGGIRLASANFEAVRRALQERDPNYAYYGKECWLNAEYGTATVVDDMEALAGVRALVARQPFVPVQLMDVEAPADAQ